MQALRAERADASLGIDGKSLVHNANELMKKVLSIHEELQDAALAEEYIDGREFFVGILGNLHPTAFPPIEMDFSGLKPGQPHILDQKAKFDESSAEFKGTRSLLADVPDELKARLQKVSLDAYRALRVRDYGRVDLRLKPDGNPILLEVNPNPDLAPSAGLARSANRKSWSYDELILRIVAGAEERFRSTAAAPSH